MPSKVEPNSILAVTDYNWVFCWCNGNWEHAVIVRAEQKLLIYAWSAKSANAAAHAPTFSCLVRADLNYEVFIYLFIYFIDSHHSKNKNKWQLTIVDWLTQGHAAYVWRYNTPTYENNALFKYLLVG